MSACEPRIPPEIEDQSVRPARVMTVNLENQDQHLELVGRVEAAQSIDLAFEVSGPLYKLPIREGQEVKKGQLLAAIDPGDLRLAVSEARVQLRLAQQDLDRKASILSRVVSLDRRSMMLSLCAIYSTFDSRKPSKNWRRPLF